MLGKKYEPPEDEIIRRVNALKKSMRASGQIDLGDIDDDQLVKMVKNTMRNEHKAAQEATQEDAGAEMILIENDEPKLVPARKAKVEEDEIIIDDFPKTIVPASLPDLPSGNGNGKGKPRRHGKYVDPPIEYTSTRFALDVHAKAILPQDDSMNFLDPLTGYLPISGLQREKVILDAMSRNMKKPMLPIGYILIIGIIVILGVVIGYDAIIKDYIEASRQYEIQRELNNLPPGAQPPKLFDFKLPGINSGGDDN